MVEHADRSLDASLPRDLEYQMDESTSQDLATTRLLQADTPPISLPNPPSNHRAKTAYLDGLRGLAALFVFIHHYIFAFTRSHIHGFGENNHYHLVSLPFLRILWNGGDAGVALFFILSGYVLSISYLRKLRAGRPNDVRRGLLSAVIRRPIRLYFPPLAISLLVVLLSQFPGLLLGADPNPRLFAQLRVWIWDTYNYFSIFQDTSTGLLGGYLYDGVVWTLPIELKGSLLVYAILAVLSLGMTGADHRVPLMMTVFIFAAGAIMLQLGWKWSMAEFLLGIVIAIMDVWPIESHITTKGTDLESMHDTLTALSRIPQKLFHAASISAQRPIRRTIHIIVRTIPPSILNRLASPFQHLHPFIQQEYHHRPLPNTLFLLGWYLLTQPVSAGQLHISLQTPGWHLLTLLIPHAYTFEYWRYWNAWGAFLVVFSLLRLPWLQDFFLSPPLQYLGRISYMLYLVHWPYFRLLPGRLVSLFGGGPSDTVVDSFWDRTLAFPDFGPVGLSSRFVVCMSITLPTAIVLSHAAVDVIDRPSIEMGRWVTAYLGLDRRRGKEYNEGSSLPS